MDYPSILSLNPQELIDWCNLRRKEMGLSKARLAEQSGVPESTLDRILSGKNPEFRYSTIQPIMSVLVRFNEKLPSPAEDHKQGEYYLSIIEGYKLAVENKNYIIEEMKKNYAELKNQTEYMREQIEKQNALIKKLLGK